MKPVHGAARQSVASRPLRFWRSRACTRQDNFRRSTDGADLGAFVNMITAERPWALSALNPPPLANDIDAQRDSCWEPCVTVEPACKPIFNSERA